MVEITAERSKVKAEEDASYSTCMFLHCLPYFFNPSSVKLGLPVFCHVCAYRGEQNLNSVIQLLAPVLLCFVYVPELLKSSNSEVSFLRKKA